MGETGCGKTRLIRFMCDLQAFGSGYKTMLMMKVNNAVSTKIFYNSNVTVYRFMVELLKKILKTRYEKL